MTEVGQLDSYFMLIRRDINDVIGAFVTLVYGVALLIFGSRGFSAANYNVPFILVPARAWGVIFVGSSVAALGAAWRGSVMKGVVATALLIGLWVAWEILVVIGMVQGMFDHGSGRLVLATPILGAGMIVVMWVSLLRSGVSRPRSRE